MLKVVGWSGRGVERWKEGGAVGRRFCSSKLATLKNVTLHFLLFLNIIYLFFGNYPL